MSVPALDFVATCDDSHRVWSIAVVNRHRTEEIGCTVSLGGRPLKGDTEVIVLTGPDADAYNDIDVKQHIETGSMKFCPHSVSIIKVESL